MVVKRECPHKPAGSTQTTSTSSTTATPDGKKVSKVKAATKPSNGKESKGSIDDVKDAKNPKGKDAEKGGSQPMPEPAAPADLPQAEPMGEPAAETATDLLKEATGLLKSIRGLKAFRVKSVGEGALWIPGGFALLDGGATHALRQARPDEEADLIQTKVELACGSKTLYKHPKRRARALWNQSFLWLGWWRRTTGSLGEETTL